MEWRILNMRSFLIMLCLIMLCLIMLCLFGIIGCGEDYRIANNETEIEDENGTGDDAIGTPQFAGEIRDFLWKPRSDGGYSPGNLVVLVDACAVDVIVNGETLVDYGPGNGRCTTARSQKPGCSYGQGVRVEVVDIATRLPYTFPGGATYYTVANGCNREEFKS